MVFSPERSFYYFETNLVRDSVDCNIIYNWAIIRKQYENSGTILPLTTLSDTRVVTAQRKSYMWISCCQGEKTQGIELRALNMSSYKEFTPLWGHFRNFEQKGIYCCCRILHNLLALEQTLGDPSIGVREYYHCRNVATLGTH